MQKELRLPPGGAEPKLRRPAVRKNMCAATRPSAKSSWPLPRESSWRHWYRTHMSTGRALLRCQKKGWRLRTGLKIWSCSSRCRALGSAASSCTSCTRMRHFGRQGACSTQPQMRPTSTESILFSRRYRRSAALCSRRSLLRFLSCVMAPVMELTKDEKVTRAKSSVQTVYVRSSSFRGVTSIEAGVNCVRDQCSAVVYR
mmetsp:Transcript_63339/g.204147  ORF Transcript_63339/g.204147 Transcript_63339/m.204147 type:complete len:200 (+) Transcript_63339:435-1034(+)